MSKTATSFTATGNGAWFLLRYGDSLSYSVSGTFVGTVLLERSRNGGMTYEVVATITTAASGTVKNESLSSSLEMYRFRCSAFTSGTVVTSIDDTNTSSKKRILNLEAKVGATAGWVLGGGAVDTGLLATLPASQTASTLIVPITGLKVGEKITGFHLIGQIESAGGAVTVDADLRRHTAAAADVADASVGAITQLSATADTIMSADNTRIAALDEVVGVDETFYVLITGTTAASTDVALQGVAVEVAEAT